MGNKSSISRFLDAAEEPSQTLIPIEGYEKKELVPLEEAVEPIKNMLYNPEVMLHTATKNSEEPCDGLSTDESAAIHLYTMQWPEFHESLYELLNRTLRSSRRNDLKPWFSYLKLILTALHKLPSLKTTLWRAIRGNVDKDYKQDKIWWGFSSCTYKRNVAEQFLDHSSVRTLFKVNCVNGRSIKSHSYFPQEDEILLLPGTYFRVVKKWIEPDGLHIIELEETEPSYQSITLPFSNLAAVEKLAKKPYKPFGNKLSKDGVSQKHIKFIPLGLVGMEKCSLMNSNGHCVKRDLEHVILFHSEEVVPQQRWCSLTETGTSTYIGFHVAPQDAARCIALSDFRISRSGFLGSGVYFSRIPARNLRENRYAIICAEVHMGRVLEVTHNDLRPKDALLKLRHDYDTVYWKHEREELDEFCVNSPEQVLRWIIAVDESYDS